MTQPNPQSLGYSDSPRRAPGTQIIALVISWAVVGVPAAWGVAQTVRKSVALFRAPAAQHPASQPHTAR